MCQVAARQFPVERHFAARTEEDYLAAAYKMVSGFYVITISVYCLWGGVGVLGMTKKRLGIRTEDYISAAYNYKMVGVFYIIIVLFVRHGGYLR